MTAFPLPPPRRLWRSRPVNDPSATGVRCRRPSPRFTGGEAEGGRCQPLAPGAAPRGVEAAGPQFPGAGPCSGRAHCTPRAVTVGSTSPLGRPPSAPPRDGADSRGSSSRFPVSGRGAGRRRVKHVGPGQGGGPGTRPRGRRGGRVATPDPLVSVWVGDLTLDGPMCTASSALSP